MSPELMDIIGKGGVALLLGYMWLRAENRADKERDKNELMAKEMITAMVKTEATIETFSAIFTGKKAGQ